MHLSVPSLVVVFLLLFVLPPASPLSQSKLSVHSGPSDGDATSQLVSSGKPRIIKLLDSFGNVEKYKSMDPGVVVIGRVYLPTQPQSGDPKEVGRGEEGEDDSRYSHLSPFSPPPDGWVVVGAGEQVRLGQPVRGLLGRLQ